MSTNKAVEDGAGENDDAGDADIDRAVDDLRGVLRKGGDAQAGGAGQEDEAWADQFGDGFEGMSGVADKAFPDLDEFDAPSGQNSTHPHAGTGERRLDRIMQIPIDVQVVLGASTMPVSALMKLTEGSTIALDRKIGEPVEIIVNGRVIGRGEITVLEGDDTRFGVRLTEIETSRS